MILLVVVAGGPFKALSGLIYIFHKQMTYEVDAITYFLKTQRMLRLEEAVYSVSITKTISVYYIALQLHLPARKNCLFLKELMRVIISIL